MKMRVFTILPAAIRFTHRIVCVCVDSNQRFVCLAFALHLSFELRDGFAL